MVAKLQRVLSTNIVIVGIDLLNQPTEAERFKTQVDPDLRIDIGAVANITSGESEPSRRITSDIDRIILELLPNRVTITRQHPTHGDLPRFAEVISRAIECTELSDPTPTVFGYNIEAGFEQDSDQPALNYLGNILFSEPPQANPNWRFAGATARTVFFADSGTWTISVEPRFNDPAEHRIFLSTNLHKGQQQLPTEREALLSLNEIWEETLAFMRNLDEGS